MKKIIMVIFYIIIFFTFLCFIFFKYETYRVNKNISFNMSDIESFEYYEYKIKLTKEEQKEIITSMEKMENLKFEIDTELKCYGLFQDFINVNLKNGMMYEIHINYYGNRKPLICVNMLPMYVNKY